MKKPQSILKKIVLATILVVLASNMFAVEQATTINKPPIIIIPPIKVLTIDQVN